ncbi:TadE/TadG family type IV pilus assembly protein [Protofrankia symbiont of Coriaria ruscifolia]|uniref:TadE/TadG family type IV pilus assembly protein n=1 Tax=Protofrankia symbiont of Coriaria ruscifolia TaxID=1306542 RepID=UPI0013EF8C78|nr:hypothetical protein [Protofrankia symbiont of Coriaria ruscifolia]
MNRQATTRSRSHGLRGRGFREPGFRGRGRFGEHGRDDRGSFAVELATGAGIFILAMAILAVAVQTRQASDAVGQAVREAARAVSLAASPTDAAQQADVTARTTLAGSGCAPDSISLRTDTADFRPGGWVTVTARCRVDLLLGPSRWVDSTADEIIDRFRGGIGSRP